MTDEQWMKQALLLARAGEENAEVPVGALLVKGDQVIAQAFNAPISYHDPSAHAEMLVLRMAGQQLENYRLVGTSLYVTLEPCVMCAMALVHARIERLVFGAFDAKTGGICSALDLFEQPFVNHRFDWQGGVLEEDCATMLQDFFKQRR